MEKVILNNLNRLNYFIGVMNEITRDAIKDNCINLEKLLNVFWRNI